MNEAVKFLVVDDIAENIVALEALLRRDGLEIHTALSGPQALELLLRHDYALALIDVNMPEMDGFELAELMRGVERSRDVPIIFVTAGSREAQRQFRGYERGAVDFLYKPIDPLVLRNKADTFFQLCSQRQQLAEQARRAEESEAKLRAIMNATSALMYVKDLDGRYLTANHSLLRLFGCEEAALLGRTDFDFFDDDVAANLRHNDLVALGRRDVLEVEETVQVDGRTRTYVSSKVAMLDEHGEPWAVCGVSSEISEQKRLAADLERAVRIREDILAIVSHDLRNPLNVIGVTSDMVRMLAERNDDTMLRSQALSMRRSVAHMDRLIRDLLDMVNLRAGRLSIQRTRVALEPLVDEALAAHSAGAQIKDLTLARALHTDIAEIDCDGDRMQQVLANLLGNAVKFSAEGGRIELRVEADDAELRFAVLDAGPGIPPEHREHLFDPYWSGERARHGGTGLGLYIAKGIVEAHGGRIWADDAPGGGAALWVALPHRVD